MEPSDASTLAAETPVWIWVLRQGKGQWCPGTVQWVAARDGAINISVKFECQTLRRKGSRIAAFMGISTAQPGFLEWRDIMRGGNDRPRHVPAPSRITPESSLPEQAP
jgi:hypothetical protein